MNGNRIAGRTLWYLVRRRRWYLRKRGCTDPNMQAVADVEKTLDMIRSTPAGEQALTFFADVVNEWMDRHRAYRAPVKRKARRKVAAFIKSLEDHDAAA